MIYSLNVKLNEGQLLENLVISELERRRKLGFIKTDRLYYYRTLAGRKRDVVYETSDCVHAIHRDQGNSKSIRQRRRKSS